MPRPSIGDSPMTGAERQARYRTARMNNAAVIRIRRPVDRRSRIQRWNDTIDALTQLQAEYGRLAGSAAGQPTRQRYGRGLAGDC
jgi:hypothetical protein